MSEDINPTSVKFPITPELPGGILVPWEELSVAVDGPTQVSGLAMDEENGKVFISFETDVIGQYTVYVKHNDVDLNRTPVTINVHKQGEEPPIQQTPAPRPNERLKSRTIRFKVPANGVAASGLTVYLKDGPQQPTATSVEQDGNDLAVSVHIGTPGKYQIGVRKNGADIPNSPFAINVPESAFKF